MSGSHFARLPILLIMLGKTGVRPWAAVSVSGVTRRTMLAAPPSTRHLSTVTTRKFFQSKLRNPIHNATGLLRTSSWSSVAVQFAGLANPRFNSTTTNPSSTSAPSSLNSIDTVNPPLSSGVESIDSLSVADPVSIDISQIPETLGYLKAIGLDYGWGPSLLIETILESLHIHGGLPWVGATITTAVLLRVAMLKFAIDASDTSAKVASVKHLTQPIQQEVKRCYRENDTIGMQRALSARRIINENYNIKLMKLAYPMIQIPLNFGAFRVLRGMSALPVPGLDSESFLWLSSVTVHDPLFILPVSTGLLMHYTFKLGGEVSSSTDQTAMAAKPLLLYGLPVLSTVCTLFLPGILQIFFASTSVLAILQSYSFHSYSFRRALGMAPFPKRPDQSSNTPTGPKVRIIEAPRDNSTASSHIEQVPKVSFIDRFISSCQNSIKDTRKKMEDIVGQNQKVEKFADGTPKVRMTKKQLQDADAYENKRREELALERETRNKERQMEYRRKVVENKRKQKEI
ncbi:membrane insertase OXA1 [Paracoccidioides brasiliensis Pb18]|uniref:Membrane insertase YidC/Oxa/ALB C-terminal domain-containing protein n=1 Tax=Paracoccidioides brasiliensis (strain Pb18) TaxID=502780 RepID=C1GJS7_PARBD|nr:membrane insertase OXA1 [Paracoccidioides brasiliensis Pb18]EEH42693.1 hypothetical protein PADG_07513 [Paracoccidioides brasiliensis Pb18]